MYLDDSKQVPADLKDVLLRWERDFGLLLALPPMSPEEQEHLANIKKLNQEMEDAMAYSPIKSINMSLQKWK